MGDREKDDGGGEAQNGADERTLETGAATGHPARSADRRVEDTLSRPVGTRGVGEQRALQEVPCCVDPDRHPQPTGHQVGGPQQQPRLHGDGDRSPPGDARVREVAETEVDRRECECTPGADPVVQEPEREAAVEDLFHDAGPDAARERRQHVRSGVEAGDVVAAEQRDEPDGCRDDDGADADSEEQLDETTPAVESCPRSALHPAHDEAEPDESDERAAKSPDQATERVVVRDRREGQRHPTAARDHPADRDGDGHRDHEECGSPDEGPPGGWGCCVGVALGTGSRRGR